MRLIDVDAFKAHWNKEYRMLHPKDIFIVALSNFPTIEAEPVRHGRWIDTREFCGDYMCSNCDALYGTNKFNYCPHCGAKMDLED